MASVACLAVMVLGAAGCGKKDQKETKKPGDDPFYGDLPVSNLSPLKGDAFPFGRPPEPEVKVGTGSVKGTLVSWNWPKTANQTEINNAGWPPKMGKAVQAKSGDTMTFHIKEVLVSPANVSLKVVPRSYYQSPTWPTKSAEKELETDIEEKSIKASRDGVKITWKVEEVSAGQWVFVFHPRWEVPIGGDAMYLVPVDVVDAKK